MRGGGGEIDREREELKGGEEIGSERDSGGRNK